MGKNNLYEVLPTSEIENFLDSSPDWKCQDNRLTSSFKLSDFETAVVVINEIAEVAKRMDHHPRLTNTYDRLDFSLCTHSVNDKVTSYDIILAKEISAIIAKYK